MAKKKTTKKKTVRKESSQAVETMSTNNKDKAKTRGKVFEGTVIRKFPKRVTIQFEKMNYVRKYERYMRSRTKVHARLPDELKENINEGDYIKVQECRPLSRIIHFKVIKKIKDKSEVSKK